MEQCKKCREPVEQLINSDDIGILVRYECRSCDYAEEKYQEYHECRVCGCSWFNACDGGCWWVEKWLCSSCKNAS